MQTHEKEAIIAKARRMRSAVIRDFLSKVIGARVPAGVLRHS